MKEKTLLVLAAGMGSRFGGLKQIEPVGPNGEFIIDYSIYSAIKYGFNKVVFIIKEENYDIFKTTIGERISKSVRVEYVFQKNDDVPGNIIIPKERIKPLGTAHAIYCARNHINETFAVISSDDYYGDAAFKELSEYLENSNNSVIVGYELGSTLSDNGSVKRGIIIEKNNTVSSVIESKCERVDNKIICTPLDTNKQPFEVQENQPVSMLLNAFNKNIFETIEEYIIEELNKHQNNLNEFELLMTDVMDIEIKKDNKIDLIKTKSKWVGVTYKSDLEILKKYIKEEISNDIYPSKLWN